MRRPLHLPGSAISEEQILLSPMDSQSLYQACLRSGSDAQADAFQQISVYAYRIPAAMLRDRPDGADLAADCMQLALVRIHRSLDQCRAPEAFLGWVAQIVRRVVIDALRQDLARRQDQLPDDDTVPQALTSPPPAIPDELGRLLGEAIATAPLSDRSRRVVIGRFFQERNDDDLAQAERGLAGDVVLPSHIQVTRAKNLAKLRADLVLVAQLRAYVGEG